MISKPLAAACALAVITAYAPAQEHDRYHFEAYQVIPVTFDEPLSVRENQPGDEFTATVTNDNGILPPHTKVDGHVVRVLWGNRFHPPSMDLHFDGLRLPDGSMQRIDAAPVPLNAKFIRHGRDGRVWADSQVMPVGAYETVGAVGGLIVGSLFNRPVLGSFLGAFGGLAAGIAAHNSPDRYLVAKGGTKVGMMIRPHDARPMGEEIAPQDRPYDVRIGDHTLHFPEDQRPYWKGDVLMLPLPYMADEMDLSVNQSDQGPIEIENQNNTLHLTQGSTEYRLNGHRGNLPAPIENRGDLTYVPVDILAAIATGNVYVNGNKLPKNS